jgi:hypothetical protein
MQGLLQAQHPTEDPVPTLHQKPAVLHTSHQQEPLPILQVEKVHRRRDEP